MILLIVAVALPRGRPSGASDALTTPSVGFVLSATLGLVGQFPVLARANFLKPNKKIFALARSAHMARVLKTALGGGASCRPFTQR
ncbi:hypothetical protein, partial [Rhizobium leguminosarum]|uniref:hypothetical protein n=1 Tax=Rhizobium leguminosarum TaxID=384 RepID=UPI001AECBFD2